MGRKRQWVLGSAAGTLLAHHGSYISRTGCGDHVIPETQGNGFQIRVKSSLDSLPFGRDFYENGPYILADLISANITGIIADATTGNTTEHSMV